MKQVYEKLRHVLVHVWYAMAIGLCVAFLFALVCSQFKQQLPLMASIWIGFAVGTVPAAIYFFVREFRKVLASNMRMEDREYLETLESEGMIRFISGKKAYQARQITPPSRRG